MRSNYDEDKYNAFCKYYESQSGSAGQSGGSLPVFVGTQHQYGAGLGDILRGIFRRVAPIVAPILKSTLGTFLGETSSALNDGKTYKESVTSALKPSLRTAVQSTIENVQKAQQGGSRHKRKRTWSKSRYGRVYKRAKNRVSNHPRHTNLKSNITNF